MAIPIDIMPNFSPGFHSMLKAIIGKIAMNAEI
jgi:hypothetical protein